MVIAAPVRSNGARAGKGGAANDEGAAAWKDAKEGIVGCVEDHVAEKIMVVVLGGIVFVVVRSVGGDGTFDEGVAIIDVVDDVRWKVEVACCGGGKDAGK